MSDSGVLKGAVRDFLMKKVLEKVLEYLPWRIDNGARHVINCMSPISAFPLSNNLSKLLFGDSPKTEKHRNKKNQDDAVVCPTDIKIFESDLTVLYRNRFNKFFCCRNLP